MSHVKIKCEIQKCSYNIPDIFLFVLKDFLLFRQTDDTYKPLLHHEIAVKEKFNIRKKIKNLSEGGCI